MWHEIFAGSNFAIFAIFSAIRKNKFPQIKITASSFPTKIYSRVNILLLAWIRYTKMQYYEIVSVESQLVSFIQKQNGIHERLLFKIKICISIAHTQ